MNARMSIGPLVALLASLSPTRAPAAPCPPSTTFFQSYAPTPTTASIPSATYDYTFTDSWTAHATFDRTQGTMALSALSGGRMTATMTVNECFDITGVAAGTPVDAFLDWRLDGFSQNPCGGAGCGVRFEFTLTAGGGSVMADADQAGPGGGQKKLLATTISRPVHFVAGSPIGASFLLDYGTGPGGSANAEIAGSYRVRGLPAGVRAIASSGADVTPTRPTSWGRVKTIYR